MRCYWQGSHRTTDLEFDPLHKGDWVAQSLKERPINLVACVEAPLATKEQILAVHEASYIESLITGQPLELATSSGLGWEPKLWPALCASAGGALAATEHALKTGSAMTLSSGSHHGLYDRGRGMCCVNDLAVVCREYPHKRIMILDFDAHGGGGTKSLVEDLPLTYQADVAASAFDRTHTEGNFYGHLCRETDDYLNQIVEALKWATQKQPDLVLYNAGMDVHEDSAQNAKEGITTEVLARREKIVADWALNFKLPVVGFLSGGYVSDKLSQDQLVNLHRMTIENLARLQRDAFIEEDLIDELMT